MTTIIAKKVKGGVKFAYDSQVTWGNSKLTSDSKVFQRGLVVFGFSGSCRDGDVVKHDMDMPEFKKKHRADPERWIIRKLIPAIQHALDKNHQLETRNNQSTTESHIIVSIPGFIGVLATDLSLVGQFEDCVGVGSGSDYAVGAVHAGASLEQAVAIAAKLDVGTGGEINVLEVKW